MKKGGSKKLIKVPSPTGGVGIWPAQDRTQRQASMGSCASDVVHNDAEHHTSHA